MDANPYAYVGCNPINRTDPTGRITLCGTAEFLAGIPPEFRPATIATTAVENAGQSVITWILRIPSEAVNLVTAVAGFLYLGACVDPGGGSPGYTGYENNENEAGVPYYN